MQSRSISPASRPVLSRRRIGTTRLTLQRHVLITKDVDLRIFLWVKVTRLSSFPSLFLPIFPLCRFDVYHPIYSRIRLYRIDRAGRFLMVARICEGITTLMRCETDWRLVASNRKVSSEDKAYEVKEINKVSKGSITSGYRRIEQMLASYAIPFRRLISHYRYLPGPTIPLSSRSSILSAGYIIEAV